MEEENKEMEVSEEPKVSFDYFTAFLNLGVGIAVTVILIRVVMRLVESIVL